MHSLLPIEYWFEAFSSELLRGQMFSILVFTKQHVKQITKTILKWIYRVDHQLPKDV